MKSILQQKKECFVTHKTVGLHKHHIYPGYGTRQICEREGFYIHLIPRLHNMSDEGIHFDKGFDLDMKKLCQAVYENTHTRHEFMSVIGRNYLDDGEDVDTIKNRLKRRFLDKGWNYEDEN